MAPLVVLCVNVTDVTRSKSIATRAQTFFHAMARVALLVAVLVTLAACAAAGDTCSCTVTCQSGETINPSKDMDCDDCDTYCTQQATQCNGSVDSWACGNLKLAAGIIAAIVICSLLVVCGVPIAICFCLGVACFAGRRNRTVTTTTTMYVPGVTQQQQQSTYNAGTYQQQQGYPQAYPPPYSQQQAPPPNYGTGTGAPQQPVAYPPQYK